MTRTAERAIDALDKALSGQVIVAGDPGYDAARKVWNAHIDRRPAAIARCRSAADVANAVTAAVEAGLEIAVRGGAHSMGGTSTVDGGLVIDLSAMNHVAVDPATKTARVGGGALLGDLDAATQAHGLAVPAGLISHTGVGGLTLGGGMGWLTRKAGLSIDNLLSAEVVTADGRILRASQNEHADLFWALRGGGGNFGVVTELEFRLHDVGPLVEVGILFWPLSQGRAVLELARDVMANLPRELNVVIAGLNAPPAPFVREEFQLMPGYGLVIVGFGAKADHEALLARIATALPPLWSFADTMPYVALQQMLDEANAWGLHNYDTSVYVDDLSDPVIDVVVEHLPRKSSPLSLLLFYRLDEAFSEVGDGDTAFSGGRSPRFAVFVVAVCPTAEMLRADRSWVRSLGVALRPHAAASGSYVNGSTDFDGDRVRAAYGDEKYERLAKIKAVYDPANVFHRNANIHPAPVAQATG